MYLVVILLCFQLMYVGMALESDQKVSWLLRESEVFCMELVLMLDQNPIN